MCAQHNKAARQFGMRGLPLAIALCLLALVAPTVAAKRPNLLVVMTDDQRADGTLDVMPETRRRIAGQGLTFLNAHATTPKCCPSRASFFTGLYAHNHRVRSNSQARNLNQFVTVQRLLQAEGYYTGIFGKYLNSWPIEADPPFFNEWAVSKTGYLRTLWNVDGRLRIGRGYSTDYIAAKVERFIREADERDDGQPWLAWVTPHAPHAPSKPPARFRNAFLPPFPLTPAMQETDVSDKPEFLDRARNQDETLVTLRDDGRRTLMAVDQLVDRILDELRRRGEADNTLVVFTSDHGYMLGEHGGVVGKDLPYTASTQIPLLLRWPGHAPEGGTNSNLVASIDVPTTLLAVARVDQQTDGRSLLAPGSHEALLAESRGSFAEDGAALMPAFQSMRTATYRYAEYYTERTFDLIFREYYDLTTDPWELENKADTLTPEQIAELSGQLAQYGVCAGRSCP